MPRDDDQRLWVEYKRSGAAELREQLIARYAPLVKYLVERVGNMLPPSVYQSRREDMLSAGVIGLMEAMERYRPQQNVLFETYSGQRIYGAVMDELRTMDWAPRSLRQKARRLEGVYRQLERELGRSASEGEVAERLEVSREELSCLLSEVRGTALLSLDGMTLAGKDGKERGLQEVLADQRAANPMHELEKEELLQQLSAGIAGLEKTERTVVALYFYERLTMKEIGQTLNVSESRVSQLCTAAVLKLRAKLVKD